MKYKTNELEGALLDAAVAKTVGVSGRIVGQAYSRLRMMSSDSAFRRCDPSQPHDIDNWRPWRPSTDWSIGGPIIDRKHISVQFDVDVYSEPNEPWYAECGNRWGIGPAALIAAMRAFVTSELGDEVEL